MVTVGFSDDPGEGEKDAGTPYALSLLSKLYEEVWVKIGGEGLIADAAWPLVDPALLIDDEVTIAVQVNGKLRDTLVMPKGAARENAAKVRQIPQRKRTLRPDHRSAPWHTGCTHWICFPTG